MTSTVRNPAELPEFPVAKTGRCPFDPPAEFQALRREAPLTRVRLWNGSTPWLVTRYADQRKVLADPRVSVNTRLPGYPHLTKSTGDGSLSFIRMDDPEHA